MASTFHKVLLLPCGISRAFLQHCLLWEECCNVNIIDADLIYSQFSSSSCLLLARLDRPASSAGSHRGCCFSRPGSVCLEGGRERQTPGAINSFTQCRGVLQAALCRCWQWVTGTIAERRAVRGDSAGRRQIGGLLPPQWSLLQKWNAIKDPTFPRSTDAHVQHAP